MYTPHYPIAKTSSGISHCFGLGKPYTSMYTIVISSALFKLVACECKVYFMDYHHFHDDWFDDILDAAGEEIGHEIEASVLR